jgi:hypothetical protein
MGTHGVFKLTSTNQMCLTAHTIEEYFLVLIRLPWAFVAEIVNYLLHQPNQLLTIPLPIN